MKNFKDKWLDFIKWLDNKWTHSLSAIFFSVFVIIGINNLIKYGFDMHYFISIVWLSFMVLTSLFNLFRVFRRKN